MARFSTFTLLLFCWPHSDAAAQTPGTGSISGTVFDPAHRVIVGADVTAVDQATTCGTRSKDRRGRGLSLLTFAAWRLRHDVRAAGFAPGTISSVQVAVGEVHSLDATLYVKNATASR